MKAFELWEEPFPAKIRSITPGFTMLSKEMGHYVILIDSNLSAEKRKEVLKHELSHVHLEHLEHDEKTRREIEVEADDYALKMTDAEFFNLMAYQLPIRIIKEEE